MTILAVNAGSSSLKFSLYPVIDRQVQGQILSGCIEGLEPGGVAEMRWNFQGLDHTQSLDLGSGQVFSKALSRLRDLLVSLPGTAPVRAVAHRVVHGGAQYRQSVLVLANVLADLKRLNPLAPLHQPHNLAGIEAFALAFASVPQVACFDTAFHASLPPLAHRFALPEYLYEQGLRRYGFHGLSYQYVMGVLQSQSERASGRVVMAHLGNGASLCGAINGKSCATTMGFSALDGLMMGTRPGALDPGVLLYLMERGWDHDQLQTLLYKQSGLLGVSGTAADMRRLRADTSLSAQLAVDMFSYHVQRECGAVVACLQGLDVLAFSGGIGEHDVTLRADLAEKLAWMGVAIDPQRNVQAVADQAMPIHAAHSKVEVWVIPTDEGVVAARAAAAFLPD